MEEWIVVVLDEGDDREESRFADHDAAVERGVDLVVSGAAEYVAVRRVES